MILYRARTTASRPRRQPDYRGNDPVTRAEGRMFTDDLSRAIERRRTLEGDSEIVMVEIADAVAGSFRVAATPTTRCGIDAAALTDAPEADYLIPMFHVVAATSVSMDHAGRKIDRIDVDARPTASVTPIAPRPAEVELPLAA